ncbi:EcsC family protein [Streptomyces cellulosae]|uniref:EcsC family protein n=1 Tax=Streptomyces cellulosae TaxID=1968 RepID=UPI000B32233E
MISGGQLAIAASAGAAAAPSGGAIAGAFVADTAVVLGLASRAVGQVSLFYGYDPEGPAEKLFVMSVVNVGTARSATAKNAAMADISRLTQALFRGKTWEVLNDPVVTKVSQQFAKAFGFRLTKKGLGKAVPAFGIVVGSTLNWTTPEGIVNAAEVAYRRRFLLEKYPHLADEEAAGSFPDTSPDGPCGAEPGRRVGPRPAAARRTGRPLGHGAPPALRKDGLGGDRPARQAAKGGFRSIRQPMPLRTAKPFE